jgi:hypothetical protein
MAPSIAIAIAAMRVSYTRSDLPPVDQTMFAQTHGKRAAQ